MRISDVHSTLDARVRFYLQVEDETDDIAKAEFEKFEQQLQEGKKPS